MLLFGLAALGAAFLRGADQVPHWSYFAMLAVFGLAAVPPWLIATALDRRRRSIRIAAGLPRYSPD